MLKRASGLSLPTSVRQLVWVALYHTHIDNERVAELDEDGVRIALTIVDTPGFGDNIDNEFA